MGRVLFMRKGETHTAPVTGIVLADMAEGSIVKLNENGSPVEFYVAKHNYESTLNGTGRTLLVRKDVHSNQTWGTEGSYPNKYANCELDMWFNNTYKSLLDENVQNYIQTTTFYYTVGGGSTGNKQVTTLARAVFALSFTELDATYDGCNNTEGSALPIASTLRIAYRNGSKVAQDTRSPWLKSDYTNDHSRLIVKADGSGSRSDCFNASGARPCFTLPATTIFDAKTMLFKKVA